MDVEQYVKRADYAEKEIENLTKTIKTLLVENPTSECQEVPEELEKLRSENTKLKYQLGILQCATAEVESKKTKDMEKEMCCFYCQATSDLSVCPICNQVYYCCEDHGQIHWPGLLINNLEVPCWPFKVEYKENSGHYLVATRDISPKETIMRDTPFAEGPGSKSSPVCLQCSKNAPEYRCSKCGLPVCDEVCEKGHLHASYECPIFAKAFDNNEATENPDCDDPVKQHRKLPKIENMYAPCPLYTCITPLRILLRMKKAQENKKEEGLCKRVNVLVDHNERRKMDQKTWMLNTVLVVGFIQKVLGLDKSNCGDLFSEESIHRAIGVLRTNSVKLDDPPGYTTGSAMYPTFSLLNHNCVCNTRTRKFLQDGNNIIELEAMVIIKKGEEICTRYTTPQLGTIRRQQLLQSQWYFSCQCRRCVDPYELGSLTNSVMCPLCKTGAMVPQEPTKITSLWQCEKCGPDKLTPAPHVMRIILKVESDISHAENLHDLKNKKEKLEAILRENENVTLHANHYLLTGAREKLIQVIMAMRGLTSNETESLQLLKYQVDLFRKVHEVMTKVDLPRDFWDSTLAKMEKQLSEASLQDNGHTMESQEEVVDINAGRVY